MYAGELRPARRRTGRRRRLGRARRLCRRRRPQDAALPGAPYLCPLYTTQATAIDSTVAPDAGLARKLLPSTPLSSSSAYNLFPCRTARRSRRRSQSRRQPVDRRSRRAEIALQYLKLRRPSANLAPLKRSRSGSDILAHARPPRPRPSLTCSDRAVCSYLSCLCAQARLAPLPLAGACCALDPPPPPDAGPSARPRPQLCYCCSCVACACAKSAAAPRMRSCGGAAPALALEPGRGCCLAGTRACWAGRQSLVRRSRAARNCIAL